MNQFLLDDLDYLDKKAPPKVYVGFWKRLLAGLIDGIGLSIVVTGWTTIIGLLEMTIPGVSSPILQDVIAPILFLLYFPLCESSRYQGSFGKYILGMKVVDEHGKRLSFGRSLGRSIAKIFSYSIASIGFLMIAFTDKKQGLHDIIASTYVIRRSEL